MVMPNTPAPTAEFLQAHWPLSGVVIGESFRSDRFARTVFVVHSDHGTYAAKVNDQPPPVEHAARELDVLTYLEARRFRHAPALLRTRVDEPIVHTGDRSVTMLEFVPGRFDPDGPPDAASWEALGRAMAALNAHRDYPHQLAQRFIDQVPSELREKVRGHRIEGQFISLLDRIETLRGSTHRGLVHGEINFANSGRRVDGTVVLLDWDGTGMGPTALDYGYPLITQFIDQYDRTFHRDAAEAFYGAYCDAGGAIDVQEAFLAALFQAMFLMWFFDVEGRWARIQWALQHEDDLCAAIETACMR